MLKQTNLIGKIILTGSTGGLSRCLVGEREKNLCKHYIPLIHNLAWVAVQYDIKEKKKTAVKDAPRWNCR